jgi:hypothetical protein
MVALQESVEAIEPGDGSPRPTRSLPVRLSIGMVALFPPLTQLAYLAVKDRSAWTYLFADDAYYYLGVARNIGTGHGSTFSGLTETNGYHPLWELVLSAVAAVVRDPYMLVAAVVAVQGLLWLWLVREALRIGRNLGSESAAAVGLAALGVLAVITGQLSFSAMESAPLLVVLMIALRMIVELDDADDPRAELRLGVVLALVCLTRLDAALTVGPLALLAALRTRPALAVVARRLVRLVGPSAAALSVYVLVNLLLFGTATPVSGQAKSLGAPFRNMRPLEQFLQAGQKGEQPLWLGAASLALCAVAAVAGDWRSSLPARRLMGAVLCILGGQALLLTYLVFATSYQVWAWYYYSIALTSFCAGTLLGRSLLRRFGSYGRWLCLAAGASFAIAQIPTVFFSGLNHTPRATATVEFLDAALPPDAVVAMGDRAGLVGYLLDRPMLQLEGLMADARWLRDLEEGTAHERMAEEGVEYYLWSGAVAGRPVDRGDGPCLAMTEPRAGDGPKFEVTVCLSDLVFQVGEHHDQFTVWRYRPELNE